jgi:hypothetical protein
MKELSDLVFIDTETGEKHKLGHIEDIELTASEAQEDIPYLNLNVSESFSAEIGWHRSAHYIEALIIGAKSHVPNNWLKKHHISMNRKGGTND